jgi:hypothetical protein
VGFALLSRLFQQESGVTLSVSPDNPALRLYRRLGFEVVDRRAGSQVMLLARDTSSGKAPPSPRGEQPDKKPARERGL